MAKYGWIGAALALAAQASFGEITLLGACPAEDSATGMRLVWHSDSPSCEVRCGPAGRKAAPVSAVQTRTPVAYTGKDAYWKYTAELTDLQPDTRYVYAVREPGGQPVGGAFRTAARNDGFNFLWMGDVHSTPNRPEKMKAVERLLAQAEAASAAQGGLSFVLFSGDAVKHGQTYACWKEWDGCRATHDYMMAMVPGNKEYYRDEGKTRWHDRWFTAARNNPPNGAPGLAGTFWFRYGNVLFVGLDTLAKEGREMDEATRQEAARAAQSLAATMTNFDRHEIDPRDTELRRALEVAEALAARFPQDETIKASVEAIRKARERRANLPKRPRRPLYRSDRPIKVPQK